MDTECAQMNTEFLCLCMSWLVIDICGKEYFKPGISLFCRQAESTSMVCQYLSDKPQADPLSGRFGGEEGGEKFLFGLLAYSGTLSSIIMDKGEWRVLIFILPFSPIAS